MALPWSSVDLTATLESMLKLEGLLKCSRCEEVPKAGENGIRLVKTGPCGHTICSGIGCVKTKIISGDGDSGDMTKCPAVGCKSFIRDFVEDREEANRIDAISSLKAIFCPKIDAEMQKSLQSKSSEDEPITWGFMEQTQELRTIVSVKKTRTRKAKTINVESSENQNSFSTDGDEYIPPEKSNLKNKFKSKTPQRKDVPKQPSKNNSGQNKKINVASLNKKNRQGETPLHCACIKLDFEKAKALIEEGANPNTQDHNGWTPLHEVAQKNHIKLLRLLLDAGSNPNVPGGDENYTPLHDAVEAGHVELVRLLIERGADKDVRDTSGRKPAQLTSSKLVLDALETDCEVTCSQLDSTISSAASLANQVVVLNPHPAISKNQDKMNILRQWERMFKDGKANDSRNFLVKLETKAAHLSQNLTHYVVEDKCNGYQYSSTPLFEALLMGAWIINIKWVKDCMKEGQLLNESPYAELQNEYGPLFKVGNEALDLYRSNAKRQLPRLFDGMNIFLQGNFQDPYPNKKELVTILEKGGAKVLKRLPDPEYIPQNEKTYPYHSNPNGPLSKCSHYILYQEGQDSGKQLIKYNMEHLKAVPVEWLFACLTNCALIDLEDFVSIPIFGEVTNGEQSCENVDQSDKPPKITSDSNVINVSTSTNSERRTLNNLPSKNKFFTSRTKLLNK